MISLARLLHDMKDDEQSKVLLKPPLVGLFKVTLDRYSGEVSLPDM
jgi:hypothetical protein